jgi:hypothetical protein
MDIVDRVSSALNRENMGSLSVREHRIIELLVHELRKEILAKNPPRLASMQVSFMQQKPHYQKEFKPRYDPTTGEDGA